MNSWNILTTIIVPIVHIRSSSVWRIIWLLVSPTVTTMLSISIVPVIVVLQEWRFGWIHVIKSLDTYSFKIFLGLVILEWISCGVKRFLCGVLANLFNMTRSYFWSQSSRYSLELLPTATLESTILAWPDHERTGALKENKSQMSFI